MSEMRSVWKQAVVAMALCAGLGFGMTNNAEAAVTSASVLAGLLWNVNAAAVRWKDAAIVVHLRRRQDIAVMQRRLVHRPLPRATLRLLSDFKQSKREMPRRRHLPFVILRVLWPVPRL